MHKLIIIAKKCSIKGELIMNKENLQKETLCIKGGYNGETLNSVTLPIVQSTSYRFDSAEQVANFLI